MHAAGGGSETGIPSFEGARLAKKELLAKGFVEQVVALDVVAPGRACFASRWAKNNRCSRCSLNNVKEDPAHRYFECSGYLAMDGCQVILETCIG